MNISTCHILHPSLVLIDAVVLINRTHRCCTRLGDLMLVPREPVAKAKAWIRDVTGEVCARYLRSLELPNL